MSWTAKLETTGYCSKLFKACGYRCKTKEDRVLLNVV